MNCQTKFEQCRGSWPSVPLIAIVLGLFSASFAGATVVGRDWQKRNPLPSGESINAFATNATPRIVAVGGHGLILSSDDGITWTQRTSGVTEDLNDVTYVGTKSKFIAVGAKSTILSSADGITWTPFTAIGSDNFRSIIFSSGQYLAAGGLGTTGVLQSSTDGVTWTRSTTALSLGDIQQIVAQGSFLYAIAPTAPGVVLKAQSAGANWSFAKQSGVSGLTATDIPTAIVATTGGLVLCTHNSAGVDLWSFVGGTSWSKNTPAAQTPALSVSRLRLSSTEVLAVGAGGDFWKSSDGFTWSPSNRFMTGQPQELKAVGKIGSLYVVGGEGGRIFSNDNLGVSSWTSRFSTGVTTDIPGVASDGTKFVGVGKDFSVTSNDGFTWTPQPQVASKTMRSVAYTGSQWVAVGAGGWTSPDGIAWTETLSPSISGIMNRVIWTGSKLVAVGVDSTGLLSKIQISDTGASWSSPTLETGSSKALRGVANLGGLFVAVGDAGMVQTSPDSGLTWKKRAVVLAAKENFTDVAFGNNLFVAVTNKGGIWTSASGATWIKRRASSAAGFNRVIFAGVQFVALGDAGAEAYSFGGLEWTEKNIGSSQAVLDAAYATNKIVAVGTAGSILSSDGTQPARPTVTFQLASSSVLEGVGTGTIRVNLSNASELPVSSLITLSGTALPGTTAKSDYSILSTTVLFPPGVLTQDITVTVKQDVLDEVDETAIFSLGAPKGDAVLGSPSVHTMTIQDDDQVPTFTAQPVSTLVQVGSSPSFSATVAASGTIAASTLTAAWAKPKTSAALVTNGVVVASPAGATFSASLASAKLTDAGIYSVTVKNPSGKATSATAILGVVDNTAQSLIVAADTTATLSVKAAGTGLLYQWLKNGAPIQNTTDGRITGTATAKLVIKETTVGDTDTYSCRVSMPNSPTTFLTAIGGTTQLGVETSVPVVSTTSLPSTTVAQVYDFTPTASGNPYNWTASGLPLGLSINAATGRITGQVKVSITSQQSYTVSLTAKNIIGVGPAKQLTLTVNPLPANALGQWTGLLDRDDVLNGGLGGRLVLAITPSGNYTGNLQEGKSSVAFVATDYVTYDPVGPVVTLSKVLQPAGLPQVTLVVTIDPVARTMVASTTNGVSSAIITGWSSNIWQAVPPSNSLGKYNFLLEPPSSLLVPPPTPQGFGYGSFTIASNGSYSAGGKLPDGQSYTCSGVYGPSGQVQIYSAHYTVVGSLHGTMTITEVPFTNPDTTIDYNQNVISGNLTWSKPDQGTTVAESHPDRRLYGTGFGATPLTMKSDGGHYFDPTATSGAIMGGLINAANNARFNVIGGDISYPRVNGDDPRVNFRVQAPAVVTNTNTHVTITKMDPASGIFEGTFTLSDTDPFVSTVTDVRTATFSGMVIRHNGQSPVNGSPATPSLFNRGFFLLERLPQTGLTGPTTIGANGNSPKDSGIIQFLRNP